MLKNGMPPVHPGEIIKEDILPEIEMSVSDVANALGVSRQMMHGILSGRKALSAPMCLKVARLFGGSAETWIRLQAAYDLKMAAQDKTVRADVKRIHPVSRSA
jgi:addiction module HigA family antidote